MKPSSAVLPRAPALVSDMDRRLGSVALGTILLLALALRVGVVLQYEAHHPQARAPVIDEASYDAWGARVARGEGSPPGVYFQEPLYPLALGATYRVFGHQQRPVRLIQAGLGALTAVLVALLAARLFGSRAGLFAGLAMALLSPALLFPALLLKPNLVLPALAATALVLVRALESGARRTWFLLGLLAGAGALLRGNVLLLLPWLVLWPLARGAGRMRLARAGCVLCGAALVLLPVALRNLRAGGEFVLTTSGAGTNLYGGNSLEGSGGVATELPFVRGIPEYEAQDWRREAERRQGLAPGSLSARDVSRYWSRELLTSLAAEPLAHLRVLVHKLRLTLGAYEVPDNHHLGWDARWVPLLRLPTGGFGFFGVLALAGLALVVADAVRGRAPPRALDLAALAGLYLATIVLTVTSMRIRLGLAPLLLPFAGVFCARVLDLRRARGRERAALVVSLGLAALVVHAPLVDPQTRAQDLAERDHNLAVQRFEEGDLDAACALARRLVQEYPRTSRFRTMAAACELERDPAAAAAVLEAVLREPGLGPREAYRARRVLARAALALEQPARAEQALAAACAFDPDGPPTVQLAALELERARGLLARDWESAAGRELVGAALARLASLDARGVAPPALRSQARTLAAHVQLDLGRGDAARRHLEAALELDPGNGEARRLLDEL